MCVSFRCTKSARTKLDTDGHTITRCSKPKDDSKGESSFDISDTFATADAGENSWEKSSFEPKAVEPTGNWESSGW